jgi:hypothetical protein
LVPFLADRPFREYTLADGRVGPRCGASGATGGARGVCVPASRSARPSSRRGPVGSVIKKRRKRMAKKKHRKLLKKTRVQRRNKK